VGVGGARWGIRMRESGNIFETKSVGNGMPGNWSASLSLISSFRRPGSWSARHASLGRCRRC